MMKIDRALLGFVAIVGGALFWAIIINTFPTDKGCSVEIPKDLWKGVFAEAVGEGYEGAKMAAYVYKNRIREGRSLGCVGLRRHDLDAFIDKHNVRYTWMVKVAVKDAFRDNRDPTGGATLYENIFKYGWPKDWDPRKVRITAVHKNHVFFKEL